ncbi:MAG: hypothetical protein ACO1OO_10085 [Flavisolibacter sp.]
MAQIFNIYFQFQDEQYSAIVSVRQLDGLTEFTLNGFDESLQKYLPGSKLISRNGLEPVFADGRRGGNSELTRSIIEAVAGHIEKVNS